MLLMAGRACQPSVWEQDSRVELYRNKWLSRCHPSLGRGHLATLYHLPFTGWGAADGEPKSYKDSLFKDSVSIFLSCKRLKEKKLWFSRPAGAQQLVRSVTAT